MPDRGRSTIPRAFAGNKYNSQPSLHEHNNLLHNQRAIVSVKQLDYSGTATAENSSESLPALERFPVNYLQPYQQDHSNMSSTAPSSAAASRSTSAHSTTSHLEMRKMVDMTGLDILGRPEGEHRIVECMLVKPEGTEEVVREEERRGRSRTRRRIIIDQDVTTDIVPDAVLYIPPASCLVRLSLLALGWDYEGSLSVMDVKALDALASVLVVEGVYAALFGSIGYLALRYWGDHLRVALLAMAVHSVLLFWFITWYAFCLLVYNK